MITTTSFSVTSGGSNASGSSCASDGNVASKHVTPRMRKALGKWAPHLIRAGVEAWLRSDRVIPRGGVPAHGVPSEEMTREIVHAAVRDLVRPGFAHVGVVVAHS